MKKTRKALIAGGLALALSGAGTAGFALSANAASGSSHDKAKPAAVAKFEPRLPALESKILHGDLTVDRQGRTVSLRVQTGTVQAASATSVTVTSSDGYTATYSLTKVTWKHGPGAGQVLPVGTGVRVEAVKNGSSATAEDLAVTIQVKKPRHSHDQPAPAPTVAPTTAPEPSQTAEPTETATQEPTATDSPTASALSHR